MWVEKEGVHGVKSDVSSVKGDSVPGAIGAGGSGCDDGSARYERWQRISMEERKENESHAPDMYVFPTARL